MRWMIAIVAVVACRSDREHPTVLEETKQTKQMSTPSDVRSCADQLRTLVVDGDLASARGLERGDACCRADVVRAFGEHPEEGTGTLADARRSWLRWRLAGDKVARAWLDGDCVLLVDVAHPSVIQSPDALATLLGAPTATLPARHNPTHQDLVYPERGLTITIGGRFETPPQPHVSYLFIYAPTTLDDYVGRLGGKDEWVRRIPLRR